MKKIAGIGACVVDTLITVPYFPKEDTKLGAIGWKRAGGGPVATGIAAAAKLGVKTQYIGVLSDDADGSFLINDFKKYGVDTSLIDRRPGRSFASVLWLSEERGTRTCVFDRGDLPPLALDAAKEGAVKDAQLLMVDGNELDAAVAAAKTARENAVKVLYDAGGLYDGIEKLLAYTDILVPSEEFALAYTGCRTDEQAAEKLYSVFRPEAVVITEGGRGGLLYDGGEVWRYPAYPVTVVDSNGAGDVFHGAFATAVVKGYDYRKCCRFASAAAALKCTGIGARESAPDFETVRRYLKEEGYEL